MMGNSPRRDMIEVAPVMMHTDDTGRKKCASNRRERRDHSYTDTPFTATMLACLLIRNR